MQPGQQVPKEAQPSPKGGQAGGKGAEAAQPAVKPGQTGQQPVKPAQKGQQNEDESGSETSETFTHPSELDQSKKRLSNASVSSISRRRMKMNEDQLISELNTLHSKHQVSLNILHCRKYPVGILLLAYF